MSMKISLYIILIILAGATVGLDNAHLIADNSEFTRFSVELSEPSIDEMGKGYFRLGLDGFGYRGKPGAPCLCGRVYRVAIPRGSDISVDLVDIDWSDWVDILPAPVGSITNYPGDSPDIDKQLYSRSFGGGAEFIGSFTIRGVEIAAIDLIPVEYDPNRGIRFMRNAEIVVNHTGGEGTACDRRLYHPAFERLYRATLVNPDAAIPNRATYSATEWDPDDGAELLVIAYDGFVYAVQPWIEWKLLKGIPTIVVPTSVTGTSLASIKSYIQTAYDTWAIPPVYLLFIGDSDQIPTYEWGDYGTGDNYYGCVDGVDQFPDIFPGRMSCDTDSHVDILVRKHLNFEMQPDMADSWWVRAVGVVNEDGPPYGPVDSSYAAAVIYAMEQSLANGFISAPVFRDSLGHTSSDVLPYIQAGCSYVVYRGQAFPDWYYPFTNLYNLNTGRKCPVTNSITCVTGRFHAGDDNICELSTRAGSVANPRGSVAWFGQSVVSVYSLERSSLSKHISEGLLEVGLNELAAAHTYGKNEMWAEFGGSSRAVYEYKTANLIGSPEMLAWTAPIQYPEVTYPSALPAGFCTVPVTVFAGGVPVENARVAITQDSTMSFAITNPAGDASIDIDVFPDPSRKIILVVTGPNLHPFVDTIDVIVSGVVIYSAPICYNEIAGNGDSLINPGETYSFYPRIVNLGMDTATTLTGKVGCSVPVIWLDSLSDFPAAATWDTIEGDEVRFVVPEDFPSVDTVFFSILISGHPDGPWLKAFQPVAGIHRFSAGIDSVCIHDFYPYGNDNGVLDVGEVADICIDLHNNTFAAAEYVVGILSTDEDSVIITLDYNDIYAFPAVSARSLSPGFNISVSPELVPGSLLDFSLVLAGGCITYEYYDTFDISIPLGGAMSSTSPWLYLLDSLSFDDSFGNDNGIIEPGELVGIRMRIENGGGADAPGVEAEVIATPFAYPGATPILLGDIPAGDRLYNGSSVILCSTAVYSPTDSLIEVPVRLTSESASYITTLKIWMPLGTGGSIEEYKTVPDEISVDRVWPNPFNETVSIEIRVSAKNEMQIELDIFDITGRIVSTPFGGRLSPGTYKFTFKAENLPSGVYYIRPVSVAQSRGAKVLLIR
ncbi:hypothetical protein DRQ36_00165 [bacterium]|nr:MAG: hypothetical protein DRQ36_00165 [bacterium]